MRKFQIIFIALVYALLMFVSCDDRDDHHKAPNQQIENAFNQQFPNAMNVDWYRSDPYSVAIFYLPQNAGEYHTGEYEAWYKSDGTCVLVEMDIENFSNLPTAVQNGYNNSKYKTQGWTIEDMTLLYRPNIEPGYLIEVEKSGMPDYDLLFASDGTLISARPDTDNNNPTLPQEIPGQLLQYVKTNYPNAKIIDYDIEPNELELEIINNNNKIKLYFDLQNNFIRSEQEITNNELPLAVKNSVASLYPDWEIDDQYLVTYNDKTEAYALDLENNQTEKEIKVYMDAEGKVITP